MISTRWTSTRCVPSSTVHQLFDQLADTPVELFVTARPMSAARPQPHLSANREITAEHPAAPRPALPDHLFHVDGRWTAKLARTNELCQRSDADAARAGEDDAHDTVAGADQCRASGRSSHTPPTRSSTGSTNFLDTPR